MAEPLRLLATCESKNAYDLLVTDVLVEEGAAVEEGALLATLEFYKVVTEITAPADGTVTAIHISRGDEVQVGDLLIELAPGG